MFPARTKKHWGSRGRSGMSIDWYASSITVNALFAKCTAVYNVLGLSFSVNFDA